MTRIFITGGEGQLGRSLQRLATGAGHEVLNPDLDRLDVTDGAAVLAGLRSFGPDWVLHCAAATKVDRCEKEVAWAEAVNARAPAIVAAACAAVGAGLVHYSTDFVFDGRKGSPYVEEDPPAPLSVYGRTKAAGEDAVFAVGLARSLVLRTQWLYGPGGRCFPAAILAKARSGESLRVVADQVGAPTMTDDLAAATLDLMAARDRGAAASGLYHAANRGALSWFAFARMILDRVGLTDVVVEPVDSAALDLPAPRPAYSVLATDKLERALGRSMPTVESGLRRYLEAEGLRNGFGRSS